MARIKPFITRPLTQPSVDILTTRLRFWITQREVDDFLGDKNIFFVLGVGRSGTKFLANLLNNDDRALVLHEPVRADFRAVVAAHKSSEAAGRYIMRFRKKKIYCLIRTRGIGIGTYGEVNSALRFHARALKDSLPDAKLMHLARDGRQVVRSIMGRGHYTGDGIGHHSIFPAAYDPLSQTWGDLSRFEKVCWLWADGNRRVREQVPRLVRFEDLTNDYMYFRQNVAEPLSIFVNREEWIEAINNPMNTSRHYTIPDWTEWDSDLTDCFWAICGDEMAALGYAQ